MASQADALTRPGRGGTCTGRQLRRLCALRSSRHESETASCQVTEGRVLRSQARTRDERLFTSAEKTTIREGAAAYKPAGLNSTLLTCGGHIDRRTQTHPTGLLPNPFVCRGTTPQPLDGL